jgi:hypothetical protein
MRHMAKPQYMEMGFNVIYLTFIFCIILIMTLRMKRVQPEHVTIAKRFLLAFTLLFIGDIAHVGVRLRAISGGALESGSGLSATSVILELISMYCLTLCFTNIWAVRFQKTKGVFYRILMGLGVLGIILILLPQNQWTSPNPPPAWSTIRILPWVIQGIAIAIVMIRDGRQIKDGFYPKLGWILIAAIACYSPSSLLPGALPVPAIALTMIVGTIFFMMMEYAPLKEYFPKKG